MNRIFGFSAMLVGLIAVGWIAYGYVGNNALALTMCLLIGAFYLMGVLELHRFRLATTSLQTALGALPGQLPRLADWLSTIHPSLQNPVRLRIEAERVALPGPAMTPYLVGLLVLLGMLGTFLGMVLTLKGAVMALETTTDLPTIRAALAAPVKGLGLAFGTSVAGVAASAMLGLVSALYRRERMQAAQLLDTQIATSLRIFSLAHQREQTLEALQQQAKVMPEVVDKLQAMMAQIERHSEELNERLLAGQDHFYQHARTSFAELATSVDQTLKHSLVESAHCATATIEPAVASTLAGITQQSFVFQERLTHVVEQQLDGLAGRFEQGATSLLASVDDRHSSAQRENQALLLELTQQTGALHEQMAATAEQQIDHFRNQSASLLLAVDRSHASLQSDSAASDQQRLAAWTGSLTALAATLQHEWQQAGAQTLAQQEQICKTFEQTARTVQNQAEAFARDTITEVSRLMATASEAPRAAAEVVGALREKLSDSMARDNDLLEERSRIMGTLSALLDAVNLAATEQRSAIDGLVNSSAAMLQQAGAQFNRQIEAESVKMTEAAGQLTGSAVDVASMSEAFGLAVQLFSESSNAITSQLQQIEAALSKSTTRSDEQLAYYVAQAREIVDLSISSQKQIVEDLQQLAVQRQRPLVGEVV